MELVSALASFSVSSRVARRVAEKERIVKIKVVILGCMVLFSSPLFGREKTDVIVMKNGDRLTCEIKGLSAGVLSIRLTYVQGTVGVEWAQVAQLESNQLFLVQTEDGTVYTGKLSTVVMSGKRPMGIQVASAPEKEIEISQQQLVKLDETAESFRQRFNGTISTGIQYSKGNQTTQYNVASEVEYPRERWSGQASVNSTFASSSGARSIATRNQADLSVIRLLQWSNWFYSGTGDFLQSSVQAINLQTTLGAGVGHYLLNSNQVSLYVLGGFAWQNANYDTHAAGYGAQNAAAALVSSELKVFRFKKTDLDISAAVLPGISEPGRFRTNVNASYYLKLFGELRWNLSFYGNWDNQPPLALAGSDYGTSAGLSWTFGNR